MDICLSGLEAESLSEESQPAELREYTTNLRDLYATISRFLVFYLSFTTTV